LVALGDDVLVAVAISVAVALGVGVTDGSPLLVAVGVALGAGVSVAVGCPTLVAVGLPTWVGGGSPSQQIPIKAKSRMSMIPSGTTSAGIQPGGPVWPNTRPTLAIS